MEFHRRLGKEAPALRRTHPALAEKIRARLAAALWPGQMVSRRTAAALGARLLLAQGRRAGLEGRRADCRRIEELRPRRKGGEGVAGPHLQSRGRGSKISFAGLRRRLLLHVEGAPFPVERHAGKNQSQGQAGARTHRAAVSAGPRPGRRLRAAHQARAVWQPGRLDVRLVVFARR